MYLVDMSHVLYILIEFLHIKLFSMDIRLIRMLHVITLLISGQLGIVRNSLLFFILDIVQEILMMYLLIMLHLYKSLIFSIKFYSFGSDRLFHLNMINQYYHSIKVRAGLSHCFMCINKLAIVVMSSSTDDSEISLLYLLNLQTSLSLQLLDLRLKGHFG